MRGAFFPFAARALGGNRNSSRIERERQVFTADRWEGDIQNVRQRLRDVAVYQGIRSDEQEFFY